MRKGIDGKKGEKEEGNKLVDDVGTDRSVKDAIIEESCSLVLLLEVGDWHLDGEVLGPRIDAIWSRR